jgi:hypothetical protein
MAELTANQESFVRMMKRSEEHARRGFSLLLARDNFYEFFDALKVEGFFEPSQNPPIVSEKADSFRTPYWDALDYLKALAKRAGETHDIELAQKLMNIVRAVSRDREDNGSVRDNYHTCRIFAEILGLLPTASILLDDLSLLPDWLNSKFNRGLVAHELDRGALPRFLASSAPDDLEKACLVLEHCTALIWIDDEWMGKARKKPVTIVEDFYLKEMIHHRSQALGARVGKKVADIFAKRVRETYDRRQRDLPSWLHRPAIEEHSQNHEWMGPENRFVEGLRDVLLSWLAEEADAAQLFVRQLLQDEDAIIRRIGIYILSERWESMRSVFTAIIGPQLFDAEHLHELYGLLHKHFQAFEEHEKAKTVDAIRQLTLPDHVTDREGLLKHIQRDWLSSVAGKGYRPADTWYQELMSEQTLGGPSGHPDFHSYIESWRGPGPTPYQAQELLAFAKTGSLVEKLNAFEQRDSWRGPTIAALVDALEEAIVLDPRIFIDLLPDFLEAKRPFQYGIINSLKRLWDTPNEQTQAIDWDKAWGRLVDFFERLISSDTFWAEDVPHHELLTPTRDWIPPVIAQFLKSGTQNDSKAYPAELLPRTWPLIMALVKKSEAVDQPEKSDAMTQAINSSKGKAIEALVIHALRTCRVSDQRKNEHAEAWALMKPVFEEELSKCQNANYEFSTLAGFYVPNLNYLDSDWLLAKAEDIFPSQFTDNFVCALDGWTYSGTSRALYALLVGKGIFDLALRQELPGDHTRERIIERIALAYLWGDEELNSPRFTYLFESSRVVDLEHAIGYFWSVRGQNLSPEHVERILRFWDRCVSWSRTTSESTGKLLSYLSRLSCYLNSISNKEKEWLLAVAPHVGINYNSDFFLEELERLSSTNALQVSAVLKALLDTFVPTYDFENRLVSILRKIVEQGGRLDAIALAEPLKHIPGVQEFYTQLTS